MADNKTVDTSLAAPTPVPAQTPTSVEFNQVKSIIGDVNYELVTATGTDYLAMADKLNGHANNLNAHAEHIARIWKGEHADNAIGSLGQMHAATTTVSARTSEAGNTYNWLGTQILPWYKDSAASMTDGYISTDGDDERARDLLDRMNVRVMEANNSLPTDLNFSVDSPIPGPPIDPDPGGPGPGGVDPGSPGPGGIGPGGNDPGSVGPGGPGPGGTDPGGPGPGGVDPGGPGPGGIGPGDTGPGGTGPGGTGPGGIGPGGVGPGGTLPVGPGGVLTPPYPDSTIPGFPGDNNTDLAGVPTGVLPGNGANPFGPGGVNLNNALPGPVSPTGPSGPGIGMPFGPGGAGDQSKTRMPNLPGNTLPGTRPMTLPGLGAGQGPGGVIGARPGGGLGVGGAGAGTGLRGGMGMGMGGMGGGSDEAEEHTRTTWLSEDEDVWGADADVAPPVIG